jgi:hypothetical protein
MIGCRKGSYVTGLPAVGCVPHPDDLADFLAQQRHQNHQGEKLKANLQPMRAPERG